MAGITTIGDCAYRRCRSLTLPIGGTEPTKEFGISTTESFFFLRQSPPLAIIYSMQRRWTHRTTLLDLLETFNVVVEAAVSPASRLNQRPASGPSPFPTNVWETEECEVEDTAGRQFRYSSRKLNETNSIKRTATGRGH